MIISYRHKGLELYALKGDRSKLHQPHVQKIKTILTRLEAAKSPQAMDRQDTSFMAFPAIYRAFTPSKSPAFRIVHNVVFYEVFDDRREPEGLIELPLSTIASMLP